MISTWVLGLRVVGREKILQAKNPSRVLGGDGDKTTWMGENLLNKPSTHASLGNLN